MDIKGKLSGLNQTYCNNGNAKQKTLESEAKAWS